MNCPRCDGLIVAEHLFNAVEGPPSRFPCWRCLNCGAIEDEVIFANRSTPPSPRKAVFPPLHIAAVLVAKRP